MNTEENLLGNPHIYQAFDEELQQIHGTSLAMIRRLIHQWEMAIKSIEHCDQEAALKIIARSIDIRKYQLKIDQSILTLLVKESPVGCDLRLIFSLSKIALSLKYLGDELTEIAKLSLGLHEHRKVSAETHLTEIVRICRNQQHMLMVLEGVLDTLNSSPAYEMMQEEQHAYQTIQTAIKAQLAAIKNDHHQVRPMLSMIQIIKSLESCSEHCKNLAEYSILMISGHDIRHSQAA